MPQLRDALLRSRRDEEIAGLTASDVGLDGYLSATGLDDVVQRYGLDADVSGSVTIRTTTMPLSDVGPLVAAESLVVTGLDLSESLDSRERSAGLGILERALRA